MDKVARLFIDEITNLLLEMISQNLGDNLIINIAKRNQAKIRSKFRVIFLRN